MSIATLKDIAIAAGVSVTTVSRALKGTSDISEATKKRILSLCDEMNYIPNVNAANLRRNHTNLVSVIASDNTNPFFVELTKTIESELEKYGYMVLIYNANENEFRELKYIRQLKGMNVAGVIISPVGGKSVELLRNLDIPYVLATRYIDKEKDSYVISDDAHGAYLATKKCLERADTDKVFLMGLQQEVSTYKDQLAGYKNALNEKGIPFNESMIQLGVYKNDDGYDVTKKIIKKYDPPYGFVCESDYLATGVLRALLEAGIKIPEQARLVGNDNLKVFSFSHPQITSIDTGIESIGKNCVKILLKKIECKRKHKETPDVRMVVPVKLIEKESC